MVSERLLVVDLDPEVALAKKRQRAWRLNVIQFPLLRLGGHVTLQVVVYLYLRWLIPDPPWPVFTIFCIVTLAYALISWGLLHAFYERVTRFDFQMVFYALDVPIYAAAVYITGGSHSWLFPIMFIRVADQTNTGFRRVVVFTHYCTACYVVMLLYAARQGPVDVDVEAIKVAVLYIMGMYVSLTARTAERLRSRTRAALHMARELITQLEERTGELEVARAQAEQASQAKSVFLAAISHELRTPLNAILGFSEFLIDEKQPTGQDQVEFLQHIHDSGQHLLTLINDILDLVKVEDGRLEAFPEEISLVDFLPRFLVDFEPRARSRKLALRCDVSRALRPVRCDDRCLRQILRCLVDNAVKFSPEGGEISLAAVDEEDAVVIEVRDRGPGIEPDLRDRVFDAFFQPGRSVGIAREGVGVGLAVARHVAARMGGEVTLDAAPGQGTIARLRLPRR